MQRVFFIAEVEIVNDSVHEHLMVFRSQIFAAQDQKLNECFMNEILAAWWYKITSA